MQDIDQLREDTPGCTGKLFLNSAGASLMPATVVAAMKAHIDLEERIGGYKAGEVMSSAIEEFYSEVARLVNCKSSNVAFTYNATDSYSRALSAIPFSPGDVVLTTNDDYISNQIAFFSLRKRWGIRVERAANLPNGDIDLNHVEMLIRERHPKLVAVTHIPTNSGLVQRVEEIGALCRQYDVWYLVDACQSVGQLPVDMSRIGCDFLSATGRKFLRGPRGTGFLCLSDKVIEKRLEPLYIDMRGATWTGADEYEIQMSGRRFETWEFAYSSLLGLKEAIYYANQLDQEEIRNRNSHLSGNLRGRLAAIPGVSVLDRGSRLSSIVTFHVAGANLENFCDFLNASHVYYSVSQKDAAWIDFTRKGVEWAIRFSPHYFNTLSEIEQTADLVEAFVRSGTPAG
jgi:selenocysteine lyase/cysteine desulfurase